MRSERPAQSVRKRPRLDDRDTEPERPYLAGQRFGQAFDGEFGRVVVANAGKAHEPALRGQVDDVAAAACTHARQHRLGHRDQAEHVGLELRAYLVVLALLDRGHVAVACVVDEHVDRAELRLGLLDGVGHLRRLRHVQRQSQRVVGKFGGNVLNTCSITRGDDGAAATLEDDARYLAAEACGAAGDEPDRVFVYWHWSVS